jgi:hypothetical protein
MSKIFGKANEVPVWLGGEQDDSQWLFKTIAEVKNSFWRVFSFGKLGPHDRIVLALNRVLVDLTGSVYGSFKRCYLLRACGSGVGPILCPGMISNPSFFY